MKHRIVLLFLAALLLCSCGESKLIFPFEGDIEKHFNATERLANGSVLPEAAYIDTYADSEILENDNFSASLSGITGTLTLLDKRSGLCYDMSGNTVDGAADADIALHVNADGKELFSYLHSEYYDTVYEKYRPTLTAFYLNENTVRLMYIIGAQQLSFMPEYPVLITEAYYKKSEFVFSRYYVRGEVSDGSEAAAFISDYCSAESFYVLVEKPLPEAAVTLTDADATAARSELLSLGYDPAKALVCLFVADLTLTDGGFILDISPNRQYKSAGLRTSKYSFSLFDGEIPFVEKTASESDKIYSAGSMY